MKWSIQNGVDGVITDDPKRFKEVSDDWVAGKRQVNIKSTAYIYALWLYCLNLVFFAAFRWRFRAKTEARRIAIKS